MLVSLLRYSVASGYIRLGLVLEVWYIALVLVLETDYLAMLSLYVNYFVISLLC